MASPFAKKNFKKSRYFDAGWLTQFQWLTYENVKSMKLCLHIRITVFTLIQTCIHSYRFMTRRHRYNILLHTYIYTCIHTYTYIYKIIMYTFEEKNTHHVIWGSNHVGTPFVIWEPHFFQTNGVPGPCFFNPQRESVTSQTMSLSLPPTQRLM